MFLVNISSYVVILGKMILLRCGLSDVVLNVPSIRSAPLISLPAPAPGDMTLAPLIGSSNIDKMRNSSSRFEVYYALYREKKRHKLKLIIPDTSRQLKLQQNCNEHVSLSWWASFSLVTASANQRPVWVEADQWEASIGDAGQGPLEPIIPCILLNICHSRDLLSPGTICPETKLRSKKTTEQRLIIGVRQDENKPININWTEQRGIFVLSCTFTRL